MTEELLTEGVTSFEAQLGAIQDEQIHSFPPQTPSDIM